MTYLEAIKGGANGVEVLAFCSYVSVFLSFFLPSSPSLLFLSSYFLFSFCAHHIIQINVFIYIHSSRLDLNLYFLKCSIGFPDGAGQPYSLTMLRTLEDMGFNTGVFLYFCCFILIIISL